MDQTKGGTYQCRLILTFNNYPEGYTQEQFLMEDLICESLKIYGMNVYYIVREDEAGAAVDLVYGEDPTAKFAKSYKIEAYMKDMMGNSSGGDFLSKFGLQLNDNNTLVISRRSFNKIVPSSVAKRPREGDLIYVPMQTNLYEIKFVDNESNFYTLGRSVNLPYLYEMRMELFKYSNENLDTGIPAIDAVENEDAIAVDINMSTTGVGNYIINELVYQGANLATSTASAKIIDWHPDTKIIKLTNLKGTIANTLNLVGSTSNTSYAILQYDRIQNPDNSDQYENKTFENTNSFIVNTETDFLGKI